MGRASRVKVNRRALHFFALQHNLLGAQGSSPITVVIDGNFLHTTLTARLGEVSSLIASSLGGTARVRAVVTRCILRELRSLGEEYTGAALAGRRLSLIPCRHITDCTNSAAECIKHLIGDANTEKIAIATQDKELRRHCQTIPGTPVIYHAVGGVRLEEPSAMQRINEGPDQVSHTLLSESDKKAVERLVDRGEVSSGDGPPRPRRKRAKGPNPLSRLKKKTKPSASNNIVQKSLDDVCSKRKRVRPRSRRKKKAIDGGEE